MAVLWLLAGHEGAAENLRKEAVARGINPVGEVFAAPLPLEEHLARHRLADLFLDTLPYNAHTTASDAVWAGLPLVTCKGSAFAGMVAASILGTIGLSELVTQDPQEYEDTALRLALERLARNRLTHPLFDTDRFRRHIESAYLEMRDIGQRGEAPRSFDVETA
jgi:predicted O-linked N-acetylglucosamine transferase (SPINDLY family)